MHSLIEFLKFVEIILKMEYLLMFSNSLDKVCLPVNILKENLKIT